MRTAFDVVIAGGAVMGASVAFWLTQLAPGPLSILVVERDASFARSATALSVASIRQQFSNPVNVRMSRFGVEFIRDPARFLGPEGEVSDLGFIEQGYLFLAGTDAQAQTMHEVAAVQRAEGAATEVMDVAALAARFPWLDLDGVVLGSHGPRDEGWFDNMGLLNGLRRAAKARGVIFVTDEVTGVIRGADRVDRVRLASGVEVACGALVNACGPNAAALLRAIGEDLPVEPRKRTVFLVDAPNLKAPAAPLLVDHTGFYLRPEHGHWITATVPDQDGPADPGDFDPDLAVFEDVLWPRLYARIPGCDAVKVLRAWAGHYDYNRLDQNAILGLWPGLSNLFLINGFSGHGLQQAPAAGRGVAELILFGDYLSLDLSPLHPDRILTGTPFLERAVV